MKHIYKKAASLLAICMLCCTAQGQIIAFQKTIGKDAWQDWGEKLIQTADMGYALIGWSEATGDVGHEAVLIKLDTNFDVTFAKKFDVAISDQVDIFSDFVQAADGGYLMTGHSGTDLIVVRTDPAGDTVWTLAYGGSAAETGIAIREASDGNIFVAGNSSSFGGGTDEVVLMKITATGDITWAKTLGNSAPDQVFDMEIDTDGGLLLAGEITAVDFLPSDAFLLKADADGNITWFRTYGGSSDDRFTAVDPTSDGGYIAAGRTQSYGAGLTDYFFVKLDAAGEVVWSRVLGGISTDECTDVLETPDGGFLVSGNSGSLGAGAFQKGYVVKTDTAGDTLWTRLYGGEESRCSSLGLTAGGQLLIGGTDIGFGASGSPDFWVGLANQQGITGCNETRASSAMEMPILTAGSASLPIVDTISIVTYAPITGVPTQTEATSCMTISRGKEFSEVYGLSLYPVPSCGKFYLENQALPNGRVEIELIDLQGKAQKLSANFNAGKSSIELEGFPAGIYTLKIIAEDKIFFGRAFLQK